MIELRQSTAGQEVPLGYFLDSSDGDTEETGLTIANTDIKLWKWGATTLANKNSGGATHISNGVYYTTLDATDTNTLGPLVIFVHVSGALTVRLECAVLPANVWDDRYVGGLDVGIRKNTALSNFSFVMVNNTDHVTPLTGATVTAQRSIDGAAFASCANSVSELSNGVYLIDLDAADLNGDVITLRFTASNADDVLITIKTTS